MYLKRLILIPFLLVSPFCFSQNNLIGIWEGKFLSSVGPELGQPKLVVEIYDLRDSVFEGLTHLYYKGNKYEHYKMAGWFSKKDSMLVFKEVSTIAVDLGKYENCLGTYFTKLKTVGSYMVQAGYWVSNIRGCSPTTDVWLKKRIVETAKTTPPPAKKDSAVKKPVAKNKPAPAETKPVPEKPSTPVVTAPPATAPERNTPPAKPSSPVIPEKISTRSTDIQSLIEIAPADKDSIKVEVYDNGEIDGDSVSVYFDNAQLINKKMITAKPLTLYVSLNKKTNPISHLRMVAESLGSIPPCTALMIVTTRSKRYEVRLSSNFNKNATVELFLQE